MTTAERGQDERVTQVSEWVLRFASQLAPGARVLDVASGSGRHANWLADQGYVVTAIDCDEEALASCERAERIHADLETGSWPLAGRRFDAVVVTNYLHRPLFPDLLACLGAQALLIYETFALGQELLGRPRRAEFLLAPNELLQLCVGLNVLAFEDGLIAHPSPCRVQRICARRVERGQQVSPLRL